jgi:hypothetical protein
MKKLLFLVFLIIPLAWVKGQHQKPINELRVYELIDSTRSAFHDRFKAHAMRIMKKYNFKIIGIWETQLNNRTSFVYMLEWPDEKTMKEQWVKFRADQEWIDIKKVTAQKGTMVGEIEDWTLVPTEYSPYQANRK